MTSARTGRTARMVLPLLGFAALLIACGSRGAAPDTTVPVECKTYEALYRAHVAQLGPGAASVGESRLTMLTNRFAHASANEQSRAELRASCSAAADALRASLR